MTIRKGIIKHTFKETTQWKSWIIKTMKKMSLMKQFHEAPKSLHKNMSLGITVFKIYHESIPIIKWIKLDNKMIIKKRIDQKCLKRKKQIRDNDFK